MQVNNNLIPNTRAVESLTLNSAVKNTLVHLLDGVGVQGVNSQKVEGKITHLTPETITEKFKSAHEDQIKTEKSTVKKLTYKQEKTKKVSIVYNCNYLHKPSCCSCSGLALGRCFRSTCDIAILENIFSWHVIGECL